jgi:hypothetical protein
MELAAGSKLSAESVAGLLRSGIRISGDVRWDELRVSAAWQLLGSRVKNERDREHGGSDEEEYTDEYNDD